MTALIPASGETVPPAPDMIPASGDLAPAAPKDVGDAGVERSVLLDLALKTAATVPQFSTEEMSRKLHLPHRVAGDLLEQLRTEHLLEVLGQSGAFGFRYTVSNRGRERAARLLEISGYVGPAPVSLDAYTAFLDLQLNRAPRVMPAQVSEALADLVLPPEAVEVAGLAASSGRSLFVFGPAGNGKTTLGRVLNRVLEGGLWIPHCIVIDNSIIRIFDPQLHIALDSPAEQSWKTDRRWVHIHRPFLVGGGELTLESFDLLYSPSLRYYEAPLHMKANGGTFLIDDFGRQRVDPHELLNRWIIPLEHQIDYLTLHTGQKVQVPFRMMLVVATNLDPASVTDPAFLRRMGYRLQLNSPTPEYYADIFQRYALRCGMALPPGLLDRLFARYRAEKRELRCCEPRDLLERVRDICRFRDQPAELTDEYLSIAWAGYFGAGFNAQQ